MASCLRCGAGNEWIKGKVKNEQCSDSDLNAVLCEVAFKIKEKGMIIKKFSRDKDKWVERMKEDDIMIVHGGNEYFINGEREVLTITQYKKDGSPIMIIPGTPNRIAIK